MTFRRQTLTTAQQFHNKKRSKQHLPHRVFFVGSFGILLIGSILNFHKQMNLFGTAFRNRTLTTTLRTTEEDHDSSDDTTTTARPERILSPVHRKSKRPLIYTFPVSHATDNDHPPTINREDYIHVLNAWRNAWERAGWQPVVLNEQNAQRHVAYTDFMSLLERSSNQKWNAGRYLRWLAVAAEGGGWMSDVNTFPLFSVNSMTTKNDGNGVEMANGGKLTVYDGMGEPLLVSGNALAWNEIVGRLMNNLEQHLAHQAGYYWSDTLGLKEIAKKQDGALALVNYENDVISIERLFSDESRKDMDKKCALATGKKAVHIQQGSCDVVGFCRKNRGIAIDKWMTSWHEKCKLEKEAVVPLPRGDNNNKERPNMYTFYEDTSGIPLEDHPLIAVWKNTWYQAGWQPIVLTLTDAISHEDYHNFDTAFRNAPFEINYYNRMCFFRWLAMAAKGGGWMSDYDTFPLLSNPSHHLPNAGRFTGHQGIVPGLVSGSASEWNRIVHHLLISFQKHQHQFWSDMLALKDIRDTPETGSLVDSQIHVITVEQLYQEELKANKPIQNPYDLKKKCKLAEGMEAVHFSHASCDMVGFCHEDREHSANEWIRSWREQCLSEQKDTLKTTE